MSAVATANTTATKSKKSKFKGEESLIGPTDRKVDTQAREAIVLARTTMLFKQPFFGNLAMRLTLVNADEWCETAATDGARFYYNSRFINMLSPMEVVYLVGHEVLHLVYDHLGRRDTRDPRMWNVACDYAVNNDLNRHRVGTMITTVPCLYDDKYKEMAAEEIYEDLMNNAKKISMDDLVDMLLDDHMDGDGEGEGEGDGEEGEGQGRGKRPQLSPEEREAIRREIKQAIVSAAQSVGAGDIPANVARMLELKNQPQMDWRELIQTTLTSAIRSDYSWMRVSRRGWDIDAIMPGMKPGEEIDVAVAIDMSGSISNEQAQDFLAEISGMMDSFDGYRIHVFSFDTTTYNPQDFTSENMRDINEYVPYGGGGTDFDVIFKYLRERAADTKRLIVFTDGYPCGSWGDANFCDTVWIIHGDPNPNPPFGIWAVYDDHKHKR